jgi:hypothetical protein
MRSIIQIQIRPRCARLQVIIVATNRSDSDNPFLIVTNLDYLKFHIAAVDRAITLF